MKKTSESGFAPSGRNWLKRVGLLSAAVLTAAIGTSQQAGAADNQKFIDLFFKQGYEWCDARKLGKIFETSPTEAKVIAGQKIAANNLAGVRQAWDEGVAFFRKHGFSCGSGSLKNKSMDRYAYNDAKRIAEAWTGRKS